MLDRRQMLMASAGLACLPYTAAAQTEAVSKTVRVLVGFPPGGSADVVSRLIVEQLKGYAPTIIVDNRPGAGGRIALSALKASAGDGATLAVTPASMIATYPHIYKSLDYDPLRDFAPVSTVCASPFLLTVGPAVPASVTSLKDFLAWCKANPSKAYYGSSGAGSMPHFTGVMLAREAGIEFTHVPYKGAAPAMQDLLGGQVAANIGVLSNALPHVKAGTLRALATSGPGRSTYLPDVPTFRESGLPKLEAVEWFGMFAPASTPPSLVAALNKSVRDALTTPQTKSALAKQSFEIGGNSPAEFAAQIKSDFEKWGPIIKASGFTAAD